MAGPFFYALFHVRVILAGLRGASSMFDGGSAQHCMTCLRRLLMVP